MGPVNSVNTSLNDIMIKQNTTQTAMNVGALSCGATNDINISNCDINNSTILQETGCITKLTMGAENDFSARLSSTTNQVTKQAAEAVSQNYTYNPGSTTASNISENLVDINQSISQTMTNQCISGSNVGNKINCDDGKIDGSILTQSAFADATADCIFNNSAAASSVANVSQTVDQHSSAKQENAIAKILIAAAIFVVALALLLVGLGRFISGVIGPFVKIIITILLLALLLYVPWVSMKKYDDKVKNKKQGITTADDYCADCANISEASVAILKKWKDDQVDFTASESPTKVDRALYAKDAKILPQDEVPANKDAKAVWDNCMRLGCEWNPRPQPHEIGNYYTNRFGKTPNRHQLPLICKHPSDMPPKAWHNYCPLMFDKTKCENAGCFWDTPNAICTGVRSPQLCDTSSPNIKRLVGKKTCGPNGC